MKPLTALSIFLFMILLYGVSFIVVVDDIGDFIFLVIFLLVSIFLAPTCKAFVNVIIGEWENREQS